jgi:hypothetical protein
VYSGARKVFRPFSKLVLAQHISMAGEMMRFRVDESWMARPSTRFPDSLLLR